MVSTDRIKAALFKVAALVDRDPAFTPVFERLESELDAALKAETGKSAAQERAARLLAQRAKGSSKAKACSRLAP